MDTAPRPQGANQSMVAVATFCREVLSSFRDDLSRRQVHVDFDVDANLVAMLPNAVVKPALQRIIEDACRNTPDGESLDICVMQCPEGIEIEVADSRCLDSKSVMEYHRSFLAETPIARAMSFGVELETHVCPQGGLARTLVVPLSDEQRRSVRFAA